MVRLLYPFETCADFQKACELMDAAALEFRQEIERPLREYEKLAVDNKCLNIAQSQPKTNSASSTPPKPPAIDSSAT
jgi:hypothetical protein